MYSNSTICDILMYIDKNIYNKISIADLESKFFYNRYYMMKLFKNELGSTIIEYINSIKIYKSIEYIKNSSNSLLYVSTKSGFYSLEYFSETFKKITGLTPYTFKKYFKNKTVSDTDILKIEKSINELFKINCIKDIYLSKRKPQVLPTKKLSIFR